MPSFRPRCIVIAGPNGAGKSTLAPHLLGEALDVGRFVNVDTIATGLAGLSPSATEGAAGRLAIAAIDGYIATTEQIEEVCGRAVRRALAVHKALGLDTVVWRDGQVVHVPPEELPDLPPEDRGPVRYRLR